ncbi:TetR/AcrR family transcriptional regulator [Streptomyces griseus]|uniref:TetR/AcrR family transcriptional regulator n=1 Tax=Streptomyces griseus TaxID=1911 RepID=UPI00378D2BDC
MKTPPSGGGATEAPSGRGIAGTPSGGGIAETPSGGGDAKRPSTAGPGRRPGRPPSLTRAAIAEAALAEGVATFSMPGVAARLGVGHSTLYRCVDNREALVRLAVELVAERTVWPSAGPAWRALLTGFADALWGACEAFPGLDEAILTTPGTPRVMVDLLTGYGGALVGAGLTPRDAAVAVDFVADLVFSSSVAMRGLDRRLPDAAGGSSTARERYRRAWARESAGRHPFEAEFTAEETWHGRGWFDDKLDIFLDGLATRIAPGPSRAPDRAASPGPSTEENA